MVEGHDTRKHRKTHVQAIQPELKYYRWEPIPYQVGHMGFSIKNHDHKFLLNTQEYT